MAKNSKKKNVLKQIATMSKGRILPRSGAGRHASKKDYNRKNQGWKKEI